MEKNSKPQSSFLIKCRAEPQIAQSALSSLKAGLILTFFHGILSTKEDTNLEETTMTERILTLRELNRATLARQLLLERASFGPLEAIERLICKARFTMPTPTN